MSENSHVVAVAADGAHRFSKRPARRIVLVAGIGVEGDAHAGTTVQHRSRVARDPGQPNLRQVHLLDGETLDRLAAMGFALIGPGAIGENILVRGVDLLALPRGTALHIGRDAIVTITGLRNPCRQLDTFRPGLMQALLDRDAQGGLIRKGGVMAVVTAGGDVLPGDPIRIRLPAPPRLPLAPV